MLAELADLKNFLDLADIDGIDSTLELCLISSDSFIKSFCHRTLELTTHVHTFDCETASLAYAPEFPITSIQGITIFTYIEDQTGLSTDLSYVRFYKDGKIRHLNAEFYPSIPQCILMEYTAGYSPESQEGRVLKYLCLEIAGQIYRNRGIMNTSDYDGGAATFTRIVDPTAYLGPEILIQLMSYSSKGPRVES